MRDTWKKGLERIEKVRDKKSRESSIDEADTTFTSKVDFDVFVGWFFAAALEAFEALDNNDDRHDWRNETSLKDTREEDRGTRIFGIFDSHRNPGSD